MQLLYKKAYSFYGKYEKGYYHKFWHVQIVLEDSTYSICKVAVCINFWNVEEKLVVWTWTSEMSKKN